MFDRSRRDVADPKYQKAIARPDAPAALYEEFRDYAKRFAYLHLGNHHDAEDVVQSTWIRVLTSLHQFRAEGKFSSWLGTIILHECRAIHRRSKRSRTISLDSQVKKGRALEVREISGPHLIEAETQSRQMRREMRKHIILLPPIFRTVLILHYVEDFGIPQIAEKLQISESATKSRLRRARIELTARLTQPKYGHPRR